MKKYFVMMVSILGAASSLHAMDHDLLGRQLIEAIQQERPIDEIQSLVEVSGADVNYVAPHEAGMTPLMCAAAQGLIDIAHYLLAHCADIDAQDDREWTPLLWAISEKKREMALFLMSAGADINYGDTDGLTPLMLAARNGMPVIVAKLLHDEYHDENETLNDQDDDGMTALMYAIRGMSEQDEMAIAALNDALYERCATCVHMLLNAGAYVGAYDNDGNTVLHYVAKYTRDDSVLFQELINQGADSGALNVEIASPLFSAAYYGMRDIVQLLLARGENVNAHNIWGQTPLHEAASNNQTEVFQILLEHGANIRCADDDGDTPLMIAAWRGSVDVVRFLLAREMALRVPERRSDVMHALLMFYELGHNRDDMFPPEHIDFTLSPMTSIITDRNEDGQTALMVALDYREMAWLDDELDEAERLELDGRYDEVIRMLRDAGCRES